MPDPLNPGLHPGAADAVSDPGRLRALTESGMAAPGPEPGLDRLSALAAQVTGAATTLVNFVGVDRAHAKGAYNFQGAPDRSLPLSHVPCQHVVGSGSPLVVADTTADPLVRDNGAVTEFGVEAYLGVPVRAPSGHVLGTVCALEFAPHQWTADDVESLAAVAEAVQCRVARRAAEVARRAAEAAQAEAERLARLQSTLLANMSHEIRTPLTAIIGYAEVLDGEVPPPLRELTQPVLNGGRRLMRTLNAVLDLAQIEAGRMAPRPRPTPVGPLLGAAVEEVRPLAERKGLAIRLDVPANLPVVRLDASLLDRAVTNLLANAVKFTEAGGITVRARHDAGTLHVNVADTGIGIDPEHLPHLFEPFHQAAAGDDRPYEGNGLGLAIVRRVTELMGGAVTVDSEVRNGSAFHLAVPAPAAV